MRTEVSGMGDYRARLDEAGLQAATRTFDTGPMAQFEDAYKRTSAATAIRAYLDHADRGAIEALREIGYPDSFIASRSVLSARARKALDDLDIHAGGR